MKVDGEDYHFSVQNWYIMKEYNSEIVMVVIRRHNSSDGFKILDDPADVLQARATRALGRG